MDADIEIVAVPPEEPVVRRFSHELWLPYQRDLEAAVSSFALADDIEDLLEEEEVAFRKSLLESDDYFGWVAVESFDPETDDLSEDGTFVGFITAKINEAPPVFDQPDRVTIGDVYIDEPYRGSGLADSLVARLVDLADAHDCTELRLEVDVDNERAQAYYEKLGFEIHRHIMTVPVDQL